MALAWINLSLLSYSMKHTDEFSSFQDDFASIMFTECKA